MVKKNKIKIIIVILAIVCVITLLSVIVYNTFIKKNNTDNLNTSKKNISTIGITGKLKETITNLGKNYTIKYYGFFPNNENKKEKAVVEYTKSDDSYALLSNDIDIHIVYKNNILKSISKKLKMVFNMPESAIDIYTYNLIGNYSQQYIETFDEKISDKQYYVEEYKIGENIIKYYFLDDEVKYVRYNDELISIIRIEKTVNNELFDIPSNYTEIGK